LLINRGVFKGGGGDKMKGKKSRRTRGNWENKGKYDLNTPHLISEYAPADNQFEDAVKRNRMHRFTL